MHQTTFYVLCVFAALMSFLFTSIVLVAQLRALRATGHKSLKYLALSSVIALVLIPAGLVLQFSFWQPFATYLYVATVAVGIVQGFIAVWGTRKLLSAVSQGLVRAGSAGNA